MNRPLALLIALLVVPLPALGAPTAKVSIANVTVSPSQPASGERFTVTTTIRNGESTSSSPSNDFEITAVTLRGLPEDYRAPRVDDVGVLPEGTSVDVPLSFSFETPGTREFRVVVYGRDGNRAIALRYPVVVTVRQGGPALDVETAADPVVGATTNATVTVANGEETNASGLDLSLAGSGVTVENPSRVLGTLGGGESRTFSFAVTPRETRATLVATLTYRTPSGFERTVEESIPLRSDPLREDVRVDATVPGDRAKPPVTVDVANFGNAPLKEVVVSASAEGEVVGRRPVANVSPRTTRTVDLDVSGVESANLTVRADYETGSREGTASTRVRYAANPGRIELTGIDYERDGSRVHLSGSASNVGLGEVQGVVVSVVPAPGVEPARPSREYFVGTVPASDFVSFDLYAAVGENVTAVPIRASYLVDGDRHTDVREVSIADLPPPSANRSSGPSPAFLFALVGLVIVVGIGLYAYRHYR